jgi:3-deoxy-D-manno-octulosonate 8-phosphate phosphatase (KDO 8-P phosphatase)
VPVDLATLEGKARRVRLVLLDVDGVLTDSTILLSDGGEESKRFSIRDGTALVWATQAGLTTGLLSGRVSAASSRRALQLSIPIVVLGGTDKRAGLEQIRAEHGFTPDEIAYMGDDILDLPVLTRVGLSSAPADAVAEVRDRVDWIAGARGGRGAVRELIELILRAQGRWDAVVAAYLERETS